MKEHNRLRIERLTARYSERMRVTAPPDELDFLRAFDEARSTILSPQMEEIAAELRRAGHESRVVFDEGPDRPSIELELGLLRGRGKRNVVGFSVIRWVGYPLQILAYLMVNPPAFDLERYKSAAEIVPERVEQLLVDAVEHVLMCNAP